MDEIEIEPCCVCNYENSRNKINFLEVAAIYKECTGFYRETTENQKICQLCYKNLIRLQAFRKRCLRTEIEIENHIENDEIDYEFTMKCRICLIDNSKDELRVQQYSELFKYCSGFPLEENNMLLNMCQDCFDDMKFLEVFIEKYELMEARLRNVKYEELHFFCSSPTKEQKIKVYSQEQLSLIKYEEYYYENFYEIEPKDVQICSVCGFVTNNKYNLARHMDVKHNPEEFVFFCDHCPNITFRKKQYLWIHMKQKHLGKRKSYMCEHCGETFNSCDSHYYHVLRKHTKPENYKFKCHICPRNFITNSLLTQHINIHLGIKNYSCDLCGKSFVRLKSLKEHKETHNDDASYKCEKCSKTFKARKSLIAHHLTHEDRCYHCPLCKSSFTVPVSLRKHMANHHPDFKMPPLGTSLKNFDWTKYGILENCVVKQTIKLEVKNLKLLESSDEINVKIEEIDSTS